MIAKFLKESVILQKDNRDGLIEVMKKLNGKVITGSLSKYNELGWWFTKDFGNESVICFSYVYSDSPTTLSQHIYLFTLLKDGDKSNVDRSIGKPFPAYDSDAKKRSDVFVNRVMKELTRASNGVRLYKKIADIHSENYRRDWTKGKI